MLLALIITKFLKMLFSIDKNTDEIIVSQSSKGSVKVKFVERIRRDNNEILYNAVSTLVSISQSNNIDTKVFELMDKVCHLIYNKYKQK